MRKNVSKKVRVFNGRRKRSYLRPEDGAAALEMAILLPMLLLLLMGIMEFGYAFFVDLSLTNAVREGARVGVTVEHGADVVPVAQAKVIEYVNNVLGAQYVAALDTSGIQLTETDHLEVVATISNYPALSPFQLLSDSVLPNNISARAVMRWELAGVSP